MKKTGIKKVLGREPHDVRNYYNRTGRRDKDGKPVFEVLTMLDFTSPPMISEAYIKQLHKPDVSGSVCPRCNGPMITLSGHKYCENECGWS